MIPRRCVRRPARSRSKRASKKRVDPAGRSPSRAAGWWRYLWASPTSALGLLAIALTASRVTIIDGVLEAHGRGIAALFDLIAPRLDIHAMTLGHVVLGRSAAALAEPAPTSAST